MAKKKVNPYRYHSLKQLKQKRYEIIETNPRFKALFGDLPTKFIIMNYGASGSGKSVLTMQLCETLADNGRVLYNSHEEKDNKSMQDRVNTFNIEHPRITVAVGVPFEEMCRKIKTGGYSFAVIDSVQYMAFTYDQLKELSELGKRKKKFGIIMVSFGQSKGNPKNAVDHLHAADVKMFFKHGLVDVESRYLGKPVKKQLFKPENSQPTLF